MPTNMPTNKQQQYGICDKDCNLVAWGLSREEVYSYMETDSNPGDIMLNKDRDVWYSFCGGGVVKVNKNSLTFTATSV